MRHNIEERVVSDLKKKSKSHHRNFDLTHDLPPQENRLAIAKSPFCGEKLGFACESNQANNLWGRRSTAAKELSGLGQIRRDLGAGHFPGFTLGRRQSTTLSWKKSRLLIQSRCFQIVLASLAGTRGIVSIQGSTQIRAYGSALPLCSSATSERRHRVISHHTKFYWWAWKGFDAIVKQVMWQICTYHTIACKTSITGPCKLGIYTYNVFNRQKTSSSQFWILEILKKKLFL